MNGAPVYVLVTPAMSVVLSPDRAEDGMASWRCVVGVGCTPVR